MTPTAAFWAVFAGVDPFAAPVFTPAAPARGVFSPTAGSALTEAQYAAVSAAARAVGDDHALTSTVEAPTPEPGEELVAARVPFDDYDGYLNSREPHLVSLENAVYSPAGRWGVLIAQDFYALVGGTPEFLAALWEHYPPGDQAVDLLDGCRGERERWGADTDWLTPLLEHLFGPARAADLVRNHLG